MTDREWLTTIKLIGIAILFIVNIILWYTL